MKSRYLTAFMAALLVAGTAGAQEKKTPGPAQKVVVQKKAGAPAHKAGWGHKEGTFTEGATLVYVRTQVHAFNTNANVTVEEEELEKGFKRGLRQYGKCHGMLLELFDKNKDGTLSPKEGQAAREFAFGVLGVLRADRNRDWQVDDAEAEQMWDRLTDAYDRHNEGTVKKFDENRDGKLDDEERKKAQERLREWKRKGGR